MPPIKQYITTQGTVVYYTDSQLDESPKPAIIYFSLSGEASLTLSPFNQPVLAWHQKGYRVFSWDLPFHTKEHDFKEGMRNWAIALQNNPFFLIEFIDSCKHILSDLIDKQLVDATQIAVSGLSRGAFIATHFAAVDARIQTILGFAPLTHPRPLEEFGIQAIENENEIDLHGIASQLIHKKLRFYISNQDTRVGTDLCYHFIRHLTNLSIEQGLRSPPVELIIYPCIGYKGHGTPPTIFDDGADWIIQQLRGI